MGDALDGRLSGLLAEWERPHCSGESLESDLHSIRLAFPVASRRWVRVQVRRRDWNSKKVLVEEQRYESVSEQCPESEASSLMSSDAENGVPGSVTDSQSLSTFGTSFVKDEDDPFAWVQRLQHVPDKASGPGSCCHLRCRADEKGS